MPSASSRAPTSGGIQSAAVRLREHERSSKLDVSVIGDPEGGHARGIADGFTRIDRVHFAVRIQLWSYNYDPEPTGIGIVSTVWARAMRDRGHEVEVVAAHPHYPEPQWGTRVLPYREVRDGIKVLRLPLWIGRGSAAERYRQE